MQLNVGLSVREFRDAVQKVQRYRDSLQGKCEQLCRQLTLSGLTVMYERVNESPLGHTIMVGSDITPVQAGCKAVLFATGQVKTNDYGTINTLFLVEFGAGIHYNKIENPLAAEYGMGVGTFPGQIHAFDEKGWYYFGEDEQWHHSYGVKATMPVYKAGTTIRLMVMPIAREVFRNDRI